MAMFHDRNYFRSLQLRRLTLGRRLLEVSGPSRPWRHGWLGGLLITPADRWTRWKNTTFWTMSTCFAASCAGRNKDVGRAPSPWRPRGLARSNKISGTGDTPKMTSGKGQGGHWLIVNLAINHTCVVRLNDISINTTPSMYTLLTFKHLTSNFYR